MPQTSSTYDKNLVEIPKTFTRRTERGIYLAIKAGEAFKTTQHILCTKKL